MNIAATLLNKNELFKFKKVKMTLKKYVSGGYYDMGNSNF